MKSVSRFLAITTGFVAAAFVIPLLWAAVSGDGGLAPIALSCAIGAAASCAAAFIGREARLRDITSRGAVVAVLLSWLFASFIASLPYRFGGVLTSTVDSLFEGVSGLTTTGASVIADISSVPQSILLWRALSQWFGGIGIVVLALIFFPASSAAMQLFRAEVAGSYDERMTPRVQKTAIYLCSTYAILTAIEFVILMLFCRLSLFNALTLSLSTMATGGFLPTNGSVGAFGGMTAVVVSVFLVLASINLTLYWVVLSRRSLDSMRNNPELRTFIGLIALVGVMMSVILYAGGHITSVGEAFEQGFFHTISSISTCGFFITDTSQWPASVRLLTILMMFTGGCAISASGGMTCGRVATAMKHVRQEFTRVLHPRAIMPVRFGSRTVDDQTVSSCFGFITVYFIFFFIGIAVLSLCGLDMATSVGASAASLGNVGPGFSVAGSTMTCAQMPDSAKLTCMALMLLGRLEFFSVLMLFSKSFRR